MLVQKRAQLADALADACINRSDAFVDEGLRRQIASKRTADRLIPHAKSSQLPDVSRIAPGHIGDPLGRHAAGERFAAFRRWAQHQSASGNILAQHLSGASDAAEADVQRTDQSARTTQEDARPVEQDTLDDVANQRGRGLVALRAVGCVVEMNEAAADLE